MAGIKCPAHKIPVRQAMTDGIRLPAIMITQMEIKLLINRQSSKNPAFARMDHNNILIMIVVLVITSPIWGTALVSIAGILLGIVSAVIGHLRRNDLWRCRVCHRRRRRNHRRDHRYHCWKDSRRHPYYRRRMSVIFSRLRFLLPWNIPCHPIISVTLETTSTFWDWITGKLTGKEQSY